MQAQAQGARSSAGGKRQSPSSVAKHEKCKPKRVWTFKLAAIGEPCSMRCDGKRWLGEGGLSVRRGEWRIAEGKRMRRRLTGLAGSVGGGWRWEKKKTALQVLKEQGE